MYELAEHLHMTVGQLVDVLEPAEVTGWKAYFSVRDYENELRKANSDDGSVGWVRPPWEVKRDG